MKFERDEEKNLANIEKHGVLVEEAMRAFPDPKRKIRLNKKHAANELRYYCLGKVAGRVLTVRFLIRDGRIGIIGAGYWREGRRIYEKS